MDNLNISTGERRLTINNDPARVIIFNTSDVVFIEKFYRLIGEFQTRLTAFQEQGKELDADSSVDENGIPVNMPDRFELVKNACTYMREKIDSLFGAGTSQNVFGDTYSLDAMKQFLEGITPFIQTARADKIQKYTNKRPRKNGK